MKGGKDHGMTSKASLGQSITDAELSSLHHRSPSTTGYRPRASLVRQQKLSKRGKMGWAGRCPSEWEGKNCRNNIRASSHWRHRAQALWERKAGCKAYMNIFCVRLRGQKRKTHSAIATGKSTKGERLPHPCTGQHSFDSACIFSCS